MNIGIDARLLSTPLRGTARYVLNLLEYLYKIDRSNKYFIFQYEDLPRDNSLYEYVPIKKSKLPRQIFEHYWLNFKLPHLISKLNIEIFFTPYIFVPFKKGKWKNVIAIHDSLTKTSKEYYTYRYRKYMDILVPLSIKRSDKLITISKSAMEDIVKFYSVSPDKIQFLYHWTSDRYKPIMLSDAEKEKLMKKFNLSEKYILFVSVLEKRKNLEAIIKVSDILVSRKIDIKFVLVGRPGFGYDDVKSELNRRKDRIIIISEVSDNDLVLIYNCAAIFFFPTHYEGFGLPLLEAMSCGVPVISSNNSSVPEVIGDAGFMGDSNDYYFFADSIVKLLNNHELYNRMKEKAIFQAKKFSPEDHINKLVNIFNALK